MIDRGTRSISNVLFDDIYDCFYTSNKSFIVVGEEVGKKLENTKLLKDLQTLIL